MLSIYRLVDAARTQKPARPTIVTLAKPRRLTQHLVWLTDLVAAGRDDHLVLAWHLTGVADAMGRRAEMNRDTALAGCVSLALAG